MKIFRDSSRSISEKVIWVCIHECYLYTAPTLFHLINVLNKEWESDKHLVG